jgi:hypothetical protein
MSKVHTKDSLGDKLAQVLNVNNRRTVKVTKKKTTVKPKKTSAVPLKAVVSKTAEKVDWKSRKDSGKIVMEIGKAPEMNESNADTVNIETITKQKTPFRYMYDKIRQKSDVLSNHLTDVGELLLEQNDLGYATPIITNSGVCSNIRSKVTLIVRMYICWKDSLRK